MRLSAFETPGHASVVVRLAFPQAPVDTREHSRDIQIRLVGAYSHSEGSGLPGALSGGGLGTCR
jgi:hypothetical protein